jgi:nicotinamide-nucleotide amidase
MARSINKKSAKAIRGLPMLLKKDGLTLSLAESCTGGLVSSIITDISGSSVYFHGAVVAYDNAVKTDLLKVPPDIIKKYGAVSDVTAVKMAKGALVLFGTDIALSITGIAGPKGASPGKPAGLAYAAITSGAGKKEITSVMRIRTKGSRIAVKQAFAREALRFLAEFLRAR